MNEKPFDFHGFHSLRDYERECVRSGFTTRRVPFQKGGSPYFALVVSPPKTPTSVEAWTLFPADETAPVLDGVINGVPGNYLGKLAAHGFYPVMDEIAPLPPPEPAFSFDASGQCRLLL